MHSRWSIRSSFLALLLGCLAISRRFLDPWSALFATFVVSFTPSVFHASRFFHDGLPRGRDCRVVGLCVVAQRRVPPSGLVMLFGLLTGLGI